ncbi:Uncharacterised protein [Vibrio cholerae]|nr:Uncharacterised protein [Vibrio cholerae]
MRNSHPNRQACLARHSVLRQFALLSLQALLQSEQTQLRDLHLPFVQPVLAPSKSPNRNGYHGCQFHRHGVKAICSYRGTYPSLYQAHPPTLVLCDCQ